MKASLKRTLLVAGMIILICHFMLVFTYVLNPGTYSSFYSYPFFHQNWNLFVPPPTSNYNLYAVYENNGEQTTDIFEEIMHKHQSNRFNGSEALLLALSNTIHIFEKRNEPDAKTNNFAFIERFAKNYLEETRNIKLEKLKIILVVDLKNPGQARTYHN